MKTGIKDAGRASGFELANGSFTNLPIDLAKFALNRLPLALSRIFRRRPGNYVDGLLSPFQRISFGPLASSFPPWIRNDVSSIADQTRTKVRSDGSWNKLVRTFYSRWNLRLFVVTYSRLCIKSWNRKYINTARFTIYARFRNLQLIRGICE